MEPATLYTHPGAECAWREAQLFRSLGGTSYLSTADKEVKTMAENVQKRQEARDRWRDSGNRAFGKTPEEERISKWDRVSVPVAFAAFQQANERVQAQKHCQ